VCLSESFLHQTVEWQFSCYLVTLYQALLVLVGNHLWHFNHLSM